jgi:cytochrome oxidase Cu insertion factor (SCO1/SenC/PrrC family)
MNEPEKLSRTIWVGVGLVIVLLCLSFVLSRVRERPKPESALPVIGKVADFALTNQFNQPVTLADLRGKVWVADIIFTSCAGPCPRMTRQMRSVQEALPKASGAKLVTLTTHADFDTPEVLKKYGEKYNADFQQWMFLTGDKVQIANLGIDSLKLTAVEKKPEERTDPADLFIHSTIFVLVDKQARLRGIYETGGENVEWDTVKKDLLAAMAQLEREP